MCYQEGQRRAMWMNALELCSFWEDKEYKRVPLADIHDDFILQYYDTIQYNSSVCQSMEGSVKK